MNNLFDYNNSFYKILHNRKYWLYAFLLLLPFGLPKKSVAFLVNNYLEKAFTNENNTIIAYLAVGILFIIIYSFISKFRNRYIISPTITFLTILISWWIWYFQIFDFNKNEFIGIANLDWFYFAYMIYFICILNVSLFLWGNYSQYLYKKLDDWNLIKKTPQSNGFLTDKPIENITNDTLGRKEYAVEIAGRLLSGTYDKAFALGITGSWGSGKTSFVNLIKDAINQDSKTDKIIIEFNPWNSQNPNQIIEDFFKTFKDRLSPYSSELSSEVVSYAKDLVQEEKGFWGILSNRIINFFDTNDTISEKYNAINETLQKLDKKVIIIIDDLDRLDKSEIIEVIRLIRNTANFYNTCFIVAYDKSYVTSAIGEMNDYQKEYYLEKIFQLEVVLPREEPYKISQILIKNLKILYPNNQELVNNLNKIDDEIIRTCFSNMRDINRFLNSFDLNYNMIKDDILLSEFILIEMLRFKHPKVIDFIYLNQNILFTGEPRLFLIESFKEKLKEYEPKLLISTETFDIITKVFESLIGHNHNSVLTEELSMFFTKEEVPYLSIRNSKNFYRYFSLRILSNQILKIEFETEVLRDVDIIKSTVRKWLEDGFTLDIVDKFYHYKPQNSNDLKNHIKVYLFLINNINFDDYDYGLEKKKMIEQIVDKLTSPNFVKGLSESELKNFVKNLLESAVQPFYAERLLIQSLRVKLTEGFKFCMTTNELEEIVIQYFEKYFTQNSELDFRVFSGLFQSSDITIINKQNGRRESKYPQGLQRKVWNFAISNPDIFLDLIIVEDNNGFKLFYSLIKDIYNNIGDFEKLFVNSSEIQKSTKFNEFQSFYRKLKDSISDSIKFSFKEIRVNKWGKITDLSKR